MRNKIWTRETICRASMRGSGAVTDRVTAAAAQSRDRHRPARLSPRGRRRDEGWKQKRQRKRESEANAAVYGTPGGAAGNMLSGRTSTCAPARADPGYLEDQIAFGVTLLFGNVGAETSPPFRALFLKILQDLENKRETRDSRKRARRARSADGVGGHRSSRGVRGGAGARASTHRMH